MNLSVVQIGDARVTPVQNEQDRGHHYFRYVCTVTDYAVGNTVKIRNNALGGYEVTDHVAGFNLPLAHCGNFQHSGCVHNIEAFEYDSGGNQVGYASQDITIHNEPFYYRMYSKSPYIAQINCAANDDTGIDDYVVVLENAEPNEPVNAYVVGSLDPVYTITANGGGQATFFIPTTQSGLYLFSSAANGKNESMPTNGVELYGRTCDYTLTPQVRVTGVTIACNGSNADVIPNVVGGSGNYEYSFTNNEQDWQSLGVLNNQAPGTYHIYIRDAGTNQRTAVSYVIDCTNTTTIINGSTTTVVNHGTTIINTTQTIVQSNCISVDKLLVNMSDVTSDMVTDVKCTYSYNLSNDGWVSAHDYQPDYVFSLRNTNVISFKNKTMYKHNANNKCVFYGGAIFESYITPVFTNIDGNELRPLKAILYRSVNWNCDFLDSERRKLNKTFSSISLHNSYQSTYVISLKPITKSCNFGDIDRSYNVKMLHNKWYFNRIKDSIIDRSKHSYLETICDFVVENVEQVSECRPFGAGNIKFIDDHVIIKLSYNNIEQLDMRFYEIGVEIKKVSNHGVFN